MSQERPSLAKPRSPDCPCSPMLTPHTPDGLREGTERGPKETWGDLVPEGRGWEAGWAESQSSKEDGLGVAEIWLDQAPFPHWDTRKKVPMAALQVTVPVRCCAGPGPAVGGTWHLSCPVLQAALSPHSPTPPHLFRRVVCLPQPHIRGENYSETRTSCGFSW